MASDHPFDPRDQSIASVVKFRDCSVRLRDCLAANPAMGARTLRDFLADPAATRQARLATRNLGRLTADELLEMARVAAFQPETATVDLDDGADAREAFLTLMHIFGPSGSSSSQRRRRT